MKLLSLLLATVAACVLPVRPALAKLDTSLNVSCPATAAAGTTIDMNVDLANNEASTLSVRLITSIAGNANGTLGGIGIYGPLVAVEKTVNAFSTSSASVPAPPALPSALVGTVATYIILAEWQGGEDSNLKTCMVEVHEP